MSEIGVLLDQPVMRTLLIILVILVIQLVLHSTLDRIVERVVRSHKHTNKVEERKREDTLKKVFRTSSAIVIWLIGIFVILWSLDVKIGSILTGAGLFSVVAGLSAQSVIRDYLAGLFIILENQYRVDDIVTLATPTATVSGVVEDVSIRMTRLRDMDGNMHIVSNGSIGVITNQSFQFANVNLNIKVTYDTDIDLVEKLINKAGQANAKSSKHKDDVIEPIQFLRVESLNESNVTVKCFGKVRAGSQWDVSGDFRRRLKDLFDEHGLAVPYASTIVKEPAGKE